MIWLPGIFFSRQSIKRKYPILDYHEHCAPIITIKQVKEANGQLNGMRPNHFWTEYFRTPAMYGALESRYGICEQNDFFPISFIKKLRFRLNNREMYSFGQPPYGDMRGVDVIKIVEEGKRLSKPDACPEHVYGIMNSCWNYHAKDRPTFSHLTEFFSNDPDYTNLIELIKTQSIS